MNEYKSTDTVFRYDIRLSEDRLPMLVRECVLTYDRRTVTAGPKEMADWVDRVLDLRHRSREVFCIIGLDNRNSPIGLFFLTQGTVNASIVSVRDIFLSALSIGAVKIIAVHCHPSGFCSPSYEDRKMAYRIRQAGRLMDVELMDFLIVASEDGYLSFLEENLFKEDTDK